MRYLLLIIFTLCHYTLSQAQRSDVVLFYNVENLFDTINNPQKADEDFLPLADREWNSEKYQTKISRIADIIANAASADLPTLVGFAEVENRSVVEDIAHSEAIASANYEVCHFDSPDERGIDVAMLYRPDRFKLKGCRAIRVATQNPSRDMLTLWGEISGRETFIALLHWPSRIGGVKFTENERRTSARQLRSVIDSVHRANPHTQIIVMGDMNDNPNNKSIREDLRARHNPRLASELYNPFVRGRTHRGSSVYDGRWNMYDNIVVSQNIPLRPISRKNKGGILKNRDLLDQRGRPLPTYRSTEYLGGVSDHLPIYIIISE